ncbi:uncharacterized protein LOC133034427 [Cannabis sativa]|uniref:uncharacterized protein LOC133034427 n=1 Tax=Cannabis sativa TaxID=3483 RepID=UPI0029CA8CA6|nr:uncharacterized protein LOC133034427 [Cannabis sativa]
MYQVVSKLKSLKPVLKEINKAGFSNMHTAVQRANGELESVQQQLQQDPLDVVKIDGEIAARAKLIQVQQNYTAFLQQKAKVTWIQNGDLNTAIFHASIKQRARQNQIFSIESKHGTRITDPNLISAAFVDYYKELLGTSLTNRRPVLKKLVSRGAVLSTQQAENLMMQFTKDEVKGALFDIPGNKALGPDGYSSFFFSRLLGDSGR